MGTASFDVSKYGKNRGTAGGQVISSDIRLSGAFGTSTTAANMEDASGDIILAHGDVLTVFADEAMRVAFGGTAATASTGFYIAAGTQRNIECNNPGTVSIRDVA